MELEDDNIETIRRIKNLLDLASDIEAKCGIRLYDDIYENARKDLCSPKYKDKEQLGKHHHRGEEGSSSRKNMAGPGEKLVVDTKEFDHGMYQDFSSTQLIKELEKLSSQNKELQTKCIMKDHLIQELNSTIVELNDSFQDGYDYTIKLVAQREKLILQLEDSNRKFHTALFLTGTTEKDVTHFLQKNPKANKITDEMIQIKSEIKHLGGQKDKYELLNPKILKNRVEQLEKYTEVLNSTNHDRVSTMKEKIHSMQEEHCKIVHDLLERIQNMAKRIAENNEVVHSTLIENLQLKDAKVEMEANFNKEKKKLLGLLKSNNIDQTNFAPGPTKLSHSAVHDTVLIKKLQNSLSRTQNDLLRRENEIEQFRREFLQMEKKVYHSTLEKERFQKLYQETIRKMSEKNGVLARRSENIDQRRKLEVAGFRSDIQEFRRLLTVLEKKLNYCLCKRLEKRMLEDIGDANFIRDAFRTLKDGGKDQKKTHKSKPVANKISSSTNMKENAHSNVIPKLKISKPTVSKRSNVSSKLKERNVNAKTNPSKISAGPTKVKSTAVQDKKERLTKETQQKGNEGGQDDLNSMADLQKFLEKVTHRLQVLQNNINQAHSQPLSSLAL